MLSFEFINNGTGTKKIGNYWVSVLINGRALYETELYNFHRDLGWPGLIRCFVNQIDKENLFSIDSNSLKIEIEYLKQKCEFYKKLSENIMDRGGTLLVFPELEIWKKENLYSPAVKDSRNSRQKNRLIK